MTGQQSDQTTLNSGPSLGAVIVVASIVIIFWDGLGNIILKWEAEHYNHGYLIPFVAMYLLWLKAEELGRFKFRGAWFGILATIGGLMAFLLGELSGIYIILQYGFMLTLFGVLLAAIGWAGMKMVWVPLVYLFFMIPLPEFLYQKLSSELQLISSELGVAVIRMFGISVFLEGNVIDLGIYKLQVAEACSGLRYLFPLMSFGFLCAAIYRGPWWHRAIIFLSSIPVTVLMNSFRIGVIGVLVENFGIEQAEGFLHYFEGWIVFMACVGILFLEMWLLNRFFGSRRPLLSVFGLDVPPVDSLRVFIPKSMTRQIAVTIIVLVAGVAISIGLQKRDPLVPERETLSRFPLSIADWRGRDGVIDQVFIDVLKLDDYLLARFRQDGDSIPVELWIAYYDSQKKGQSTHSPRTCLPAGGWVTTSFETVEIAGLGGVADGRPVNRVVIKKGEASQLVYYWFVERGRILTNEYVVKWFIFWDALTRNRTDGALVRISTFVPDAAQLGAAEARLQAFMRAVDPQLAYFLPGNAVTYRESMQAQTTGELAMRCETTPFS